MFGLMKARTCSGTPEVKRRRRMHYCGACKTIGRLYGQKARLLLNHDTVFLAELLTALSGQDHELGGWADGYRSYNCMSLPRSSSDMPMALQLAAAATMVMAEFKIADHVSDRQGSGWRLAGRAYRSSLPGLPRTSSSGSSPSPNCVSVGMRKSMWNDREPRLPD